jgi:hypothetical protein
MYKLSVDHTKIFCNFVLQRPVFDKIRPNFLLNRPIIGKNLAELSVNSVDNLINSAEFS